VGSSANGIGGDDVTGSSTTDGVDGSVVLVEHTVALEFLVEAEDVTVGGGTDVAGSSTAAVEMTVLSGALGEDDGRCRKLLGDFVVVAGSAAAGVVDLAGGNGFGDDDHYDCCLVAEEGRYKVEDRVWRMEAWEARRKIVW